MRYHGQAIENNFTKGLITEATGLNFPDNACTETFNCIFHEKAEVRRRLGIDYEDGFAFGQVQKAVSSNFVVTEYVWDNVAGLADFSFAVIQVGARVHFWQVDPAGALSSHKKSFTIDLTPYSTKSQVTNKKTNALPGAWPCQFSAANGYLIIAHPYCDPLYVTYFPDTDTISSNIIQLQIRDFDGIPVHIDNPSRLISDDERPQPSYLGITFPDLGKHVYNIKNQGWYVSNVATTDTTSKIPLDIFIKNKSVYPSNADVWWLSKNANEQYDYTLADSNSRGTTAAPKGHYLLNAFYQDRLKLVNPPPVAGGIISLIIAIFTGQLFNYTVTSNGSRPSTVAFFAGRAFYSGVNAQGFHNKVYFTQILDKPDNFPKCYQQYDPTDENSPGILDNDGGYITVPEIGSVIKLLTVQGYLLVFCSNGIWAISGGSQGAGFKATDYNVQKISNISTLSPNSFVIPKTGLPIWWNSDGIFTMTLDQAKDGVSVVSLTDQTIKTFYDDIPSTSKQNAKGAYNQLLNVVQWVYRSTDASTDIQKYEFDTVLNLNMTTSAFYPWSISSITGGPTINGILASRGTGTVEETVIITNAAGEIIVDASLNNIAVDKTVSVPLTSAFRYTTSTFVSGSNYSITFAQERNSDYVDWHTYNTVGVNFDSYFIGGYKVQNDYQLLDRKNPFGLAKFQAGEIYVYSASEEDSSCFLQGIWDYSIDDSGGKYTTTQQIYKDASFVGVQRTKCRLRGRGFSLQLKFFSDPGKPFNIIGWGNYGNTGDYP